MTGIGYITFDGPDDLIKPEIIMTKNRERIGYVDRRDMIDARANCKYDHGTYDDPLIFRYFKEIKLHPSQYTIERISA